MSDGLVDSPESDDLARLGADRRRVRRPMPGIPWSRWPAGSSCSRAALRACCVHKMVECDYKSGEVLRVATKVSVRELKSRLSAYLRRVKAGETIEVAERGKAIGLIVPVDRPLDERLSALARAGLIAWSGRSFRPGPPVARTLEGTVADLIVEERDLT